MCCKFIMEFHVTNMELHISVEYQMALELQNPGIPRSGQVSLGCYSSWSCLEGEAIETLDLRTYVGL